MRFAGSDGNSCNGDGPSGSEDDGTELDRVKITLAFPFDCTVIFLLEELDSAVLDCWWLFAYGWKHSVLVLVLGVDDCATTESISRMGQGLQTQVQCALRA